MPPKSKSRKNKQDQEVTTTTRSTDTDCVIAPVADVPGFPLFLHQKFRSLPKGVRELVYGHMDMCTAHSASLACSEIHNYLVEHPLKVDKIEVSLIGDTEARQTINVRYPTEDYAETHCRTFSSSPQPLTITLEKSKLPFPTIQSMLATHNMNMSPATVVHGLQITETETITIDKININSGVDDLTEGQILHGIQTWIDFVRPTEQVVLQVEDASIVIPTGFFGLSGIKAAAGVTTRIINQCADKGDHATVHRKRPSTSSLIVNVTLKQIRKLTATKLLLGSTPRITSEEVVQWFVEKTNDWVRNPTASVDYLFARPLDDKAYNENSIIRELNLSRLAPRFVVHNTRILRMRTSSSYVSDFYGVGTIIQDMERPRALFVGSGPRILALDETDCHEIVWEEKIQGKPRGGAKRLLMPVAGWPTEFHDFPTLPKAVLEVIYSKLGFADAQTLCAMYPAAREYYKEHPFVVERATFGFCTRDGVAGMTDRCAFICTYSPHVRFERHELCSSDVRDRDPGPEGYSVERLDYEQRHPGLPRPMKGLMFKHVQSLNESLLFDGLSRVEAREIYVELLSILYASPPMEMARHQRPPQVLVLMFGAVRTEMASQLHKSGQRVGMTSVDLCKQPEKTIEGMRRWLHFIQPTFKLVLRMENQQQKLPPAIFDLPEVRAANGLVTELDNGCDGLVYDVQVDVTIAQVRALSATYIFLGPTARITESELFLYIVDKTRAWLTDRNLSKEYNFCLARDMEAAHKLAYTNQVIAVLELGNRFRVHDMSTVWPAGGNCFGFYGTFCGKIIQDTQNRRALFVGCGPGPQIHSLTDEQLREVNWGARARVLAGQGAGSPLDSCINQ